MTQRDRFAVVGVCGIMILTMYFLTAILSIIRGVVPVLHIVFGATVLLALAYQRFNREKRK